MKNKQKQLNEGWQILFHIMKYLKNYRVFIILSFFFAFVTVCLTLYIPVMIGRAIDTMVKDNGLQLLRPLLLRILVITLITSFLQWIMGLCNNKVSFLASRDIRMKAFGNLQKVSVKYADDTSTGDLLSRMTSDIDQLTDGLLLGFSQLFTSILTIIGTFLFMFMIHPGITFLVVLLTPVSFIIAAYISKKTFRLFKIQSETKGKLTNCIEESVYGLRTIQAYGSINTSEQTLKEWNQSLQKISQDVTFYSSLTNPLTRFVNGLIYAVVAVGGALFALYGMITIGSLTAFLSYASQYTKPFNEISGVITELQNAMASAKRVFDFLEYSEMEDDPDYETEDNSNLEKQDALENETNENPVMGNLEFKNVCFSYKKEQELIKNLNLSVKIGQSVAIVGPTGAGKSTLINLLMRFYDINSGKLLLDGCDINKMDRSRLRRQFGMVLQETWLKTGTIIDNIAYGKPDASLEEVIGAAKLAKADQFIEKLPMGYQTIISESGNNLSLGQRQLLCIARVMLMKTPMLILDEATSSIDARTEIMVQRTFTEMMRGRTSFIVAHRLSTIRQADIILVMKEGSIVEQGSHEELIQKKGFYYKLYQAQFI